MNKFFNMLGIVIFFILVLFSFAFSEEQLTITTYYPSPYGSYNELSTASNTYLATNSGNVGIGTTAPGAKLDVRGQVKITGGSPGAGKVLTSDASGLATWAASTACIRYTFTADSGYQECPAGYALPMAPLTPTATSGSFLCCQYQ